MTDYPLVITKLSDDEGGGFIGYYPDLPGCMSDGETVEEAAMNAQDAFTAWMEVKAESGAAIPPPGSATMKFEEREKALLSALKSMLEYTEYAEDRIPRLEAALSDILAHINKDWQHNSALVTYANLSRRELLAKH